MAKVQISNKHLQISKANTVISITVAIASFLTVASLIGARAMWGQRSYQSKVIKEKETAVRTLKENIDTVKTLEIAYKEFVGRPQNIIGGNTDGTGDRDGDNAKIVLDALPSKYDFPGLATSLEKVLTSNNFRIIEISGTDDEIVQSAKESATPEVVEMPFSFAVEGNYDAMHNLIASLERSVRPIQIKSLKFSAGGQGLQLDVDAKSYYQSEKKFNVGTKVIN